MKRVMIAFVLGSMGLGGTPHDVARSCSPDNSGQCQVLRVEGGEVWFVWPQERRNGPGRRLLGLYLQQDQHFVSPDAAPVQHIELTGGWTAILAWEFNRQLSLAGPIAHLYFVSPDRKVALKEAGDIVVKAFQGGDILGTGTDLVLLWTNGGSKIAMRTRVWRIGPSGPVAILDANAALAGIRRQQPGGGPSGLMIDEVTTGNYGFDDRLIEVFWEWDQTSLIFVPRNGPTQP